MRKAPDGFDESPCRYADAKASRSRAEPLTDAQGWSIVQQVVSSGWFFLAAMVLAYGVGNLLQSTAAARTTVHHTFDPGLLVRLAGQRTYILGFGLQVLGSVFALFARRDLPLFLVQASVAAGLGVTAILGVLVLKWSLPTAEIALLALLLAGITGLVLSAKPAHSRPLGVSGVVMLTVAALVIAGLGFFAARLHGPLGSVVLGSLAGIGFSGASIAARPLASEHTLAGFVTDPLFYLMLVHSLLAQLLLGLAMQRGSTTAAVAAMDAAAAIPAAIVGLLLLGDGIQPGRGWLAVLGFVVTLASVIGLGRYAEPQHHHATATPRRPKSATLRTAPTVR
jgi:hypothetical protein